MRVVLTIAFALAAVAQQGPEGTAVVRGRVVDAANGRPLRHLTVQKKKADTGPSSMMKTVEREEARKAQQAEYAANNN